MADKTAALIKAQQAVAQSTSMAVQDATDNLRNLSTITTTAIGVALSQLLATGDPKYVKVIEEAQKAMTKGTENFSDVGTKAAKILKDFTP
ncbi:hypothetical protein [Pseudoalteromonas luteoviolacea]|uniref:Uncharacterized protein n=2 Tax=Pseudoalteromonas luteoviolacea TaxID=43657 RepID=A0A167NE75_9GAMM|nr:hypothetical protein [Pseudoalteromonas luteoviolacea]KZN34738.1 hypothetical protein N480_20865 [Pseudoalteromonas luteoviolacea S2607]KZN68079.1 hypothetical protein N478_15765 [Pseudoalteromonas luteoviolacea S4060-1]MBQ4813135.1 hypothetical protein [Pseudoalteromonas luteoviolacea]OCQ19086.1 hypothetical protein A7985_21810 [Pseudoalteromonas luteoviolacea]